MPSIRILIVDDHEFIRRGICELLTRHPDLDVVCEASNGYEAILNAEQYKPNVILLDISIPDMNGLQAAPLIKKAAGNAEILIVTNHDHMVFVRQAFGAGARGFLLKTDLAADLVTAIREVHRKKQFLSRSIRTGDSPAVLPNSA